MSMKRTRHIHGKYWIEGPRMVHAGRIISHRYRISQVQQVDHGPAKSGRKATEETLAPMFTGEIERGSVDGDE